MAAPSLANTSSPITTGPQLSQPVPAKLCKDCKHARKGPWSKDWDDAAGCWRDPQRSLVTGGLTSNRYCIAERVHIGACGPEARFFEERQ